ncbi:MAG TPA: SOS response-associated peptidase [Cytophagaceae bacterium]|nr:SOS response-associated peptidase [Cytophagaceae bacterium]
MCYHYALIVEKIELEERYDATLEYEWVSQYHVGGFEHSAMPVITCERPKTFSRARWGLIPGWTKSREQAKEIAVSTLNAKSETVFEKASFKNSIQHKRCLVPASGFFEWKHVAKDKIPHYISLRNEKVFSFAGLYDSWIDKETGEEMQTFSILTAAANPMMEEIHNVKKRMPVILSKEAEQKWIQPTLSHEEINALLSPFPQAAMQAWTVSKLVNSEMNISNVPAVLNRQEYYESGQLF